LSAKKTFSNWLTTRYLLIIRNEENFAEKNTYRFNYARLIALLSGLFIVAVVLAILLVRVVLQQWLDPRYSQREAQRQLIEMRLTMDSLQSELKTRDLYRDNIRKILSGGYTGEQIDSLASTEVEPDMILEEKLQPIDSQFRASYEQTALTTNDFGGNATNSDLALMYFFTPMEGIISDGFNPREDHFGVDIVGKENEPVKAVADGMIIFASWTLDGGHVIGIQHKSGLVSVYKHNSELLKNVGNFVRGGEIVAIVGNSGELTSGPHLHLEIWHNGSPVNPEAYIGF